jgi:DnaJ-class molecular chaperone
MKAKGPDIGYTMSVDFAEAVNGAKKRVVMADGKALDITIPAGLKDGQTLRLRGQGQPGFGGGAPGDAMVEIHVKPHPSFRREGNNIHSILPVTVGEALGGAKVRVETVSGAVEVTVPSTRTIPARARAPSHDAAHDQRDRSRRPGSAHGRGSAAALGRPRLGIAPARR